jgi:hypothetical protein
MLNQLAAFDIVKMQPRKFVGGILGFCVTNSVLK